MEDSDILKRFDNDKLIDVVKNYKRYGYDDEIRDYAINLLKERGWSVEDLKTFGYWGKFRLRRSIDTIQSLL